MMLSLFFSYTVCFYMSVCFQNTKYIISMGGSWSGSNNDCWDYCFGREAQVVNRLTTIVDEMGLDGVDIDYEYFYEDNQNGSGFTKGAEAQKFLKEITTGLRESMAVGSELTHAPMERKLLCIYCFISFIILYFVSIFLSSCSYTL